MKSQVLRVIFRTQGRVDVEPPSVADSLRECATTSPWAWQAAVDAAVDDVEDEVNEYFSPSYASGVVEIIFHIRLIAGRIDSFSLDC
jgi:hypothetical protein